jgi:sugar lactone lactonase YvrE
MTSTRESFVQRTAAVTALIASCALLTSSLAAQPSGNAPADAARARRLSSEGIAALRTGDTAAAHRKLAEASDAWPTQPAYAWTRAQLAAAARDTADVIRALTQFATLGMSRSLTADRFLAPLAGNSRLRDVSAALTQNAAPIVHSTLRATLPDSTIWPEGLTFDTRAERFFVGSVRNRTVYVHDATGTRALWSDARRDVGAILGVHMDPDGQHLWATTAGIPQMRDYTPADSAIAALLKVRISDGAIVARWDLPPSAAGHTLGDVAVSASGDVFTSDSREPVLYRLRRGAMELESFRDPQFRSLQGIAIPPDGRHVYVADYSHGLLRVDLTSKQVTRVADAASSTSLGVDGLVWYDNSLIGIQNGVALPRVVRFYLDRDGMQIVRQEVIDRNSDVADEPTIGVLIGDEYVYVANSQWEKHGDNGVRIAKVTLGPVRLLSLTLSR